MQDLIPPRYIKALKRDTVPDLHLVFDTETRLEYTAGMWGHRWVTGAGMRLDRKNKDYTWIVDTTFDTSQALWDWVVENCQPRKRLIVWAHNLEFDLRVSKALELLPAAGFQLEGIVLHRGANWASWSSPKGSLLLVDLFSWLPTSLDKIADELGQTRAKFDYSEATDTELAGRCEEDVQITSSAVIQILQYLEQEKCGPFRPSGSGQAHACWRRKFNAGGGRVYVHGKPDIQTIERRAMWTGRAEAWQWGNIKGPLYEYDLNLAYCRIAAEHKLPNKYLGRIQGDTTTVEPTIRQVHIQDLKVPLVPCEIDDRIIWPTGTFTTTLWGPEIQLLREHNVKYEVEYSDCYESEHILNPMCEWLISQIENPDVSPLIRRMLKHWSRAIVGRMALRYQRWEDHAWVDDLGLGLSTVLDGDTGEETELLRVGRKIMELAELAESETSVPQITGWVMSECRRRLWQLICNFKHETIVYMDTDSLLTTSPALITQIPPLFNSVHKATWGSAVIHGPRNIELEGTRRIAGLPVTAKKIGPLEYEGEQWRGLRQSLTRSETDHVVITPRTYKINSLDPRRERNTDGTTKPFHLNPGDQQ